APLPEWASNPALCERILARVVAWVGCSGQPPELAHLDSFASAITSHASGHAAAVSAAGVTMLPPTARHGWLFCRQPPRQGEIAASAGHTVGTATLWDSRLVVSVAKQGVGLSPACRWSVLTLDDAAKRFGRAISDHRRWLKQERRQVAPQAVLASSPVVCVQTSGDSEPEPVFALGHAIEQGAYAETLSVR
ncbi:hypothetical protein LPJ75_006571, partial [Coemansia sp. RSA 2598]